ncbi:ATP-dependent RecD-like DNA helicase [Mucilaginibacter sp. OK098]|uniref:ATP-dependent DNA helicase n=1 Tax=Mucilaginibacter sp. OK098 TaxID=1855297 RepID=UPI000919E4CF|nr:DEAD/DEAH box helicase [Mucilaginibacter sp. OK098]SHN30518.1 UvrD-like helicase C-terminal domain-containing protein [Mucilaginibacter sp. OK098]
MTTYHNWFNNTSSANKSAKKFEPKNKLPDNLLITDEFAAAFQQMEYTDDCVYITGKAGTGKSTLLKFFRQNTSKNVVVLAPTGIAALNAEGATIHSFFRFAPQLSKKETIVKDHSRHQLFRQLDMIIIDEISMVRADVLDCIDYALKINRNDYSPFGGVQMVFLGDVYQLAPVVAGKETAAYLDRRFGGPYFFNATVLAGVNLEYIELQTIFRQKDAAFKDLLNSIRANNITNGQLQQLNKQYLPGYTPAATDVSLTLTTTNQIADDANKSRMQSLQAPEFTYPAIIKGKFEPSAYPADPNLVLKEGAQVIMLKNDSLKRWVNGSIGIVESLSDNSVTVKLNDISYTIDRAEWEVIAYQYNTRSKKIEAVVTGSFKQYPLKPAWAITIHKSQGQTYDKVIIDLGTGAFAHGQTYVALSRCTSLEGIVLKKQIRHQDIIVDPKVAQFIKQRTSW